MTLSCKEVTATMAQELEQPIYVKPNRGDAYEFDSGEWKTVSGEFRIYLHSMSLIYRKILCIIRNDWCVSLFYFFQQLPERSECPLFPAPGEVQGIGSDDL